MVMWEEGNRGGCEQKYSICVLKAHASNTSKINYEVYICDA